VPLKNDLVTMAKNKIKDREVKDPTRSQLKATVQDLFALKASGLALFEAGMQDLREFADTIELNKPELRSFVTVYAAAWGMQGVWNQILTAWMMSDPPTPPAPMPESIEKLIDFLIPLYAASIVK
jgi:hypothetical protein